MLNVQYQRVIWWNGRAPRGESWSRDKRWNGFPTNLGLVELR